MLKQGDFFSAARLQLRIMQKNSATLFLLISLLMPCIAGCKESRKYRIGVSQCSSDDWRQKMNAEIEREILLHPDAEVEIRSAEDDSRRQIEDIRYFRDSGFDILIVAPNEAAGLTPVIKEVHEGGMSVVIFDRDINFLLYFASAGRQYRAGNAGCRVCGHVAPRWWEGDRDPWS